VSSKTCVIISNLHVLTIALLHFVICMCNINASHLCFVMFLRLAYSIHHVCLIFVLILYCYFFYIFFMYFLYTLVEINKVIYYIIYFIIMLIFVLTYCFHIIQKDWTRKRDRSAVFLISYSVIKKNVHVVPDQTYSYNWLLMLVF
jgi:hypothetical protein